MNPCTYSNCHREEIGWQTITQYWFHKDTNRFQVSPSRKHLAKVGSCQADQFSQLFTFNLLSLLQFLLLLTQCIFIKLEISHHKPSYLFSLLIQNKDKCHIPTYFSSRALCVNSSTTLWNNVTENRPYSLSSAILLFVYMYMLVNQLIHSIESLTQMNEGQSLMSKSHKSWATACKPSYIEWWIVSQMHLKGVKRILAWEQRQRELSSIPSWEHNAPFSQCHWDSWLNSCH